eukprot:Nitzschia sp. Nitz4//scaffold20_size174350//54226//54957//NITZ4_002091-RA/size174350-snap-gene-0.239-mRNA-1//-1//CDS//3329541776//1541//frame0
MVTHSASNVAAPLASKGQGHNAPFKAKAHSVKFHSTATGVTSETTSEFGKLDPKDPVQQRRLEQRRKMVTYGKNTVGYTEYLRQVPKSQRKSRSMETPSTPDYTLDMPNKRWAGQVRAWRRALHSYDPPDLQQSLASAQMETTETIEPVASPSVQDRELADAKTKGLLVDFSSTSSPVSVLASNLAGPPSDAMKELDQWDASRENQESLLDDDSDDELL